MKQGRRRLVRRGQAKGPRGGGRSSLVFWGNFGGRGCSCGQEGARRSAGPSCFRQPSAPVLPGAFPPALLRARREKPAEGQAQAPDAPEAGAQPLVKSVRQGDGHGSPPQRPFQAPFSFLSVFIGENGELPKYTLPSALVMCHLYTPLNPEAKGMRALEVLQGRSRLASPLTREDCRQEGTRGSGSPLSSRGSLFLMNWSSARLRTREGPDPLFIPALRTRFYETRTQCNGRV